MPDQQPLPVKKDVTRALLLKGTVFIHLDPRDSSADVPSWLREQPQLVLQIGLEMPIPIPDLRVDDDGVFGTLSFNREPFTCTVPWDRVFAVVGDDGRGMVWPDSMPREIAAEVDREADRQSPVAPAVAEHVARANTVGQALAGEGEGDADTASSDDGAGIRASKRPMPLHTDDELPDGAFRMRSRPPEDQTGKTRRPTHVTAIDGDGENSTPAIQRRNSRAPSGKVKLPPYMRVVK